MHMERDIQQEVLDYVRRNGKVRVVSLPDTDTELIQRVVVSLKMVGALQCDTSGMWMGKAVER